MNRPQTKPDPAGAIEPVSWSLEVIRGRVLAHRYQLDAGETVLGNKPAEGRGLDLADQEGASPRKMAARQAAIMASGQELAIRDLESPGGTFVNQQRLLGGQSRRLVPGDIIQLGSVQLKVSKNGGAAAGAAPAAARPGSAATPVTAGTPQTAASPGRPAAAVLSPGPGGHSRLAVPFSMNGGAKCRTWDDFLVAAAQSWKALRDELTSGRLGEYLGRIHRDDLVPRLTPGQSADDQLDAWLARLPSAGSSEPELDVHPQTVVVRAATGGGVTCQSLRITNVGYRLLRSTARIEPPGTRWLRLRPENDGRPFATIDQTDIPIELELPETIDRPFEAFVVIESNGGTRRIGVRIERPVDPITMAGTSGPDTSRISSWSEQLGPRVATVRPGMRIALAGTTAAALRLIAILVNVLQVGGAPGRLIEPRLSALAIVLAVFGVLAGLRLATVLGEKRDLIPAGLAGAAAGLLASALIYAMLQSFESLLGSWSKSIVAVALLWGSIGALGGLASLAVIPYRSLPTEIAR